ncbi:MAG: ABC transporter ATP-binding protein [Candidatus Heimdallarchaeota archaeon]|nr:ABC transporter ATP-binding protein [Candidatus Heimdallarchaeota archaeon]MCK4877042.1 ABC transporter ATP-binding protein [Candidatus Heimdallarchaeota archaeon]
MKDAFVSVSNLSKTYASKGETLNILSGTSFEISEGELICLLGTSGSGKTTTLNILAGIDRPTSGEICYNGQNINEWTLDYLYDYRLREIGFIFQEFHLLEHLTSLENVMVPLLLNDWEEEDSRERAFNLLKQVGLANKTMNLPNELSSGEKQRVCVARAIANNPSLLIADEPTGTLDSKTGDDIMKLLQGISKKNKMTMVYTTHDPYLTKIASRIFVIQKGRIVESNAKNLEEVGYDNIIFEKNNKGEIL